MATASASTAPNATRILVWLDDQAGDDVHIKKIFTSLFNNVRCFKNPDEFLGFINVATEGLGIITVLISGRHGENLTEKYLEKCKPVKFIYVYCINVPKHQQWARKLSKVKLVCSEPSKIIECMKKDAGLSTATDSSSGPTASSATGASAHSQSDSESDNEKEEETNCDETRFVIDNNYYDDMIIQQSIANSDHDAKKDYENYCTNQKEINPSKLMADLSGEKPIQDWLNEELKSLKVRSVQYREVWSIRWFLRQLNSRLEREQLKSRHDARKSLVKFYATWFTDEEIDAMKNHVSEGIIFTEFLVTYSNKEAANNAWARKLTAEHKNKVLIEFQINTKTNNTVSYSDLSNPMTLIWFGSRQRLTKIEFIDSPNKNDCHWLLGFSLIATREDNESLKKLNRFYSEKLFSMDNKYYVIGRLLMLRGAYRDAYQWFEKTNHVVEKLELTFRLGKLKLADKILKTIKNPSDEVELWRAFILFATSDNKIPEGRSILTKIMTHSEDQLVRAKAMLGLGFHHLLMSSADEAYAHFDGANKVFEKYLCRDHPDYLKSLVCLGFCLLQNKNYTQARKNFEEVLEKQGEILSMGHLDTVRTHIGLGYHESWSSNGKKKALEQLNIALETLTDTLSKSKKKHPLIVATNNDIKVIQQGEQIAVSKSIFNYV